jgi:diguanylate cyclase (GGDEF)-like protein/PAS domain S-box-containing protein
VPGANEGAKENDRTALAQEWRRLEREREQLLRERRWLDAVWDGLAGLGVFMKDQRRGFVRPNNYWRHWGYTEADMRGDAWMDKLHPADRGRIDEELAEIARRREDAYTLEYRIFTAAGEQRDVVTKGIVLERGEEGETTSLVAMDMDVTALREAERQASAAHADAQQRADEAETLRTIGAVIASSLDVEHATRLVLEQIRHVIPYECASVQLVQEHRAIQVMGLQYSAVDDVDTGVVRETLPVEVGTPQLEVLRSGKPLRVGDLEETFPAHFAARHPGYRSWLGVPLAVKGDIFGLLVIEVTEREFFTNRHVRLAMNLVDYVAVAIHNARAYGEMREQAATDPLTGLRSRRWFFEHAEKLIGQAQRYGTDLSLLISDIDHFKRVNDDFGHLVGDRALRALASMFMQEMRTADAVCRYGGEEFAVLLPHTDIADAAAIAERLRMRAGELRVDGCDRPLSISLGVAGLEALSRHEFSREGVTITIDRLIAEADEALYRAKDEGRNRVVQAD